MKVGIYWIENFIWKQITLHNKQKEENSTRITLGTIMEDKFLVILTFLIYKQSNLAYLRQEIVRIPFLIIKIKKLEREKQVNQ